MPISKVKIIQALTLMDLPIDKVYNIDDVNKKYLSLSKLYHPDVSRDEYKDGEKFKQITEAKAFLIENYKEINMLILNNLEVNDSKIVNQATKSPSTSPNTNNNKKTGIYVSKNLAAGLVITWIIQIGLFFAFCVNYGCIFHEGDNYYPASIVLLAISMITTIVNLVIIFYCIKNEKWSGYFLLLSIIMPILLIIFVSRLYNTAYYKPFQGYSPYYVYDTTLFALTIASFAILAIAEFVVIVIINRYNNATK